MRAESRPAAFLYAGLLVFQGTGLTAARERDARESIYATSVFLCFFWNFEEYASVFIYIHMSGEKKCGRSLVVGCIIPYRMLFV